MDHVIALGQISVTAPCYSSILLDNSRKIHPRGMRACRPKDAKRTPQRMAERERGREGESPLAPLFICFSLPLGLPHANWASQECYLFYLKSSLRSSDLPLTFLGSSFDLPWFYFRGLFPSLSFSHRHSGLLFPILTT